jgi:hypothetical protein
MILRLRGTGRDGAHSSGFPKSSPGERKRYARRSRVATHSEVNTLSVHPATGRCCRATDPSGRLMKKKDYQNTVLPVRGRMLGLITLRLLRNQLP